MSIVLKKGQHIDMNKSSVKSNEVDTNLNEIDLFEDQNEFTDLTDVNNEVKSVHNRPSEVINNFEVSIGWDISDVPKKIERGLLGMLKGLRDDIELIDCDLSVFMVNSRGGLTADGLIYFGNLESRCGGLIHSGDSRTGKGDGDNETIIVDLSKIPNSVKKLVFVITMFKAGEKNISFGDVKNSFIRIVDNSDNEELIKFDLDDDYKNKRTLYAAEIERNGSSWFFKALGEGSRDKNLKEVRAKFK